VDIESQLDAFVTDGTLTEEERHIVRVPPIAKFFASPIGRRMKNAKHCWREQPFSLLVPAAEMDARASAQDEIFVQGIIDVFFQDADGRLVLLDYKTDRNTTPDLIRKRYRTQLDLYARAIRTITGRAVDGTYIYRLSDGDTIVL
ncbi:MAG: PD-(D/E)XK nuclease family protein, partial [Schwartzia sp.]|nr:PD-(D/E)XK nuclease family protein [Schwartzia sp. (in: firmicutes)]